MKKGPVFTAIFLIFLSFASAGSALRINEVELNPKGSDSGHEWVEIYSSVKKSLEGYYLVNGDGGIFNLSGSIGGYKIITFPNQFLDNSRESVYLKYNRKIVDSTPSISDSDNDARTLNLCDKKWVFGDGTPGRENSCISKPKSCVGDLNEDKIVSGFDLATLLGNWGSSGLGDINQDGIVNSMDKDILIANWGSCK